MSIDFLKDLNEPQRNGVMQTKGPVMVIAGAGSGKTRVLTYRIAFLLKNGIDAFNVLALTFTNKAAREMKERIISIVGDNEARNLWMGTFHSIFAKILRFEADKIGYSANFTIYDTDDSKSVLRNIIKEMQLDDKVYQLNNVQNRISSAKNSLISPAEYNSNVEIQMQDKAANRPLIGTIYATYNNRCKLANAMDFDDLLFNTNILFRDFADVLHKYQQKFKYVLVDEYQDTNYSQYLIVKKLAALNENICVVGDDAQSIYAFRGANIQNILNFKNDYPDVKVIKLEQNYRSTQNIVNAANSIIAKNKDQIKKEVWTDNESGSKINIIKTMSDNEEGKMVAHSIFEDKMNMQLPNKAFAILYRTNAQSRAMEEALRKLNIAYRIYGGLSFYKRKEIKDLLSYFRLTINLKDEEALLRVINYPVRGIGKTTMEKIIIIARHYNRSIFEVLENIHQFPKEFSSAVIQKVLAFTTMIKSFAAELYHKNAYELANHIATSSTILKDLKEDKTPEGISRIENIEELLNGIKNFSEEEIDNQDEQGNIPFKTLDQFMSEVALLTDADEKDDENADNVSLMTIHAAKGLEFQCVHIIGLEENLFPSQMSLSSRADLEEERRLFYVALTRAMKKATISFAETRYRWGNLTLCEPSRFIEEIDSDFVEYKGFKMISQKEQPINKVSESSEKWKGLKSYTKVEPKNLKPIQSAPPKKEIELTFEDSEFKILNVQQLSLGMIVAHQRFGIGTVETLEGTGGDAKAYINFKNFGLKPLLLKFAKLKL